MVHPTIFDVPLLWFMMWFMMWLWYSTAAEDSRFTMHWQQWNKIIMHWLWFCATLHKCWDHYNTSPTGNWWKDTINCRATHRLSQLHTLCMSSEWQSMKQIWHSLLAYKPSYVGLHLAGNIIILIDAQHCNWCCYVATTLAQIILVFYCIKEM